MLWVYTTPEMFACFLVLFVILQALSSVLGIAGEGLPLDQYLRPLLTREQAFIAYYLVLVAILVIYARLPRVPLWPGFLLAAGLVFVTPARSTDVFAYLAHGSNTDGSFVSAHTRGVSEAANASALAKVNGLHGHGPTPYGPAWTYLEWLAFKISGGDIFWGMIVLKSMAFLAFAGAVILSGPASWALLYNPLLLTELVAEGHNDALLLFLIVLTIRLTFAWRLTGAALALSCGIFVKYVPLLFAGPLFRFVLHQRRPWLKAAFVGVGLSAMVLPALYFPIWAGTETFRGVLDNSVAAPSWLRAFLKTAPAELRYVLFLLFGVYYWIQSRAARTPALLYRSCALVWLGYFLFFPKYVWAWYLAIPTALLLCSGSAKDRGFALFLTGVATLNAPLWSLGKIGFIADVRGLQHVTMALIPILGLFVFEVYSRNRRALARAI